MQRWQLAVQRQLVANTLIEISYVGNRGTRMQVTRDLNPTPAQYLSTSPVRDQATIDFLNAQVANPFYPLLPKTNLASTTVARSQLLRPYPQYSGVSSDAKRRLLLVSLAASPDREALLRRSERLAVVHLVEDHGGAFVFEPDRSRSWKK